MKTSVALGLTVSVLMTTPSWAFAMGRPAPGADSQPRGGTAQSGGIGHSSRASTLTEDTDGDGAPNCPDPHGDGDNRHPSGRDRHCEAGASGTQGKSGSDPDGPSNGGPDKPGGSGGRDLLDQDGNNGCGNDDDFEDDNNGRCLGRQRQQDATPPLTGAPAEERPDHPFQSDKAFWTIVSSAFDWHTISTDAQTVIGSEERSQVLPTPSEGAAMLAAASAGSGTAGAGPVRLASTGTSVLMLALAAFLALLAGLGLRFASRRFEGSSEA